MINLLPISQKEELKQRENLIVFLNLAISLLTSLICLLLFLLAIKFYFLGELKSQSEILKAKANLIDLELEKEISEKNEIFSKIVAFEKEKKEIFPIFNEIFEALPEGINLKSLSFSKDKKPQISLIGFSQKREDLISLKNFLEKNFSEVNFPGQVWLKEKEIDFSVNFKLK